MVPMSRAAAGGRRGGLAVAVAVAVPLRTVATAARRAGTAPLPSEVTPTLAIDGRFCASYLGNC